MADRPVVSDTTPLITLAGLGLLDLLPRLYGAIWVPEAVRTEYDAGRRGTEPPLDALSWVVIKPVRVEHPALRSLGPGEGAAVSLALSSRARAVLLDEKLGRRIASELGLPVVGTLALLESRPSAGDPDIQRLVQRLQTYDQRWYQRGRGDCRTWAVDRSTRDLLAELAQFAEQGSLSKVDDLNRFGFNAPHFLVKWATEDFPDKELPKHAQELLQRVKYEGGERFYLLGVRDAIREIWTTVAPQLMPLPATPPDRPPAAPNT